MNSQLEGNRSLGLPWPSQKERIIECWFCEHQTTLAPFGLRQKPKGLQGAANKLKPSGQANSETWDTEEVNKAALEAYSTNPLYEYQAVPGPHHVHLNNPEIVAGPIAAFLERHNNLEGPSLRSKM